MLAKLGIRSGFSGDNDGAYQSADTVNSRAGNGSLMDQLGGSYPFFTLFGIPVRVHALFPVLLVVNVMLALPSGAVAAIYALVYYGPVLFGTVYVHELGHCFAAQRVGGHVEHILLWPLGGLAYIAHNSSACDDLYVAIAGPSTHVPMIGVWMLLQFICFQHVGLSAPEDVGLAARFVGTLFADAIRINIALFLFNLLLPAYPLDGGRVLGDLLLWKGYDSDKAAKITAYVSLPIGGAITAYGVWAVAAGAPTAAITVFVGLWMLAQAYQIYQLAQEGRASEHPMFSRQNGQAGNTV